MLVIELYFFFVIVLWLEIRHSGNFIRKGFLCLRNTNHFVRRDLIKVCISIIMSIQAHVLFIHKHDKRNVRDVFIIIDIKYDPVFGQC
ncbi:hypothetical protein D3C72_2038570 [compost metagenome]